MGDPSSPETGFLGRLKRAIGVPNGDASLRAQLEEAIDEHEEEEEGEPGAVDAADLLPIERQMLRNLLHFNERTADDVAVPRSDIVAVAENTPFQELVALFAEAEHSRLPVYRGTLDEVVGMLHVKDVFKRLAAADMGDDFSALIRQPLYVPESMPLVDLLAEMRARRTHLAIVLDEYSGTEGLVTIEDLVEEIVGEIEDEHDDEPIPSLVEVAPGLWDADARTELREVAEIVDPALAHVEEDVDTLGGLVYVLADRVPAVGETVAHPSGWRLEVVEAEPKRITRLKLHAPDPAVEEF